MPHHIPSPAAEVRAPVPVPRDRGRTPAYTAPSLGGDGSLSSSTPRALWSGFARSAEEFADRPALLAEGQTLSYAELNDAARRLAATLQAHPAFSTQALTGVFAYRTPTAFAAVLGSLLAGNGYVPLNRTFPVERTRIMLQQAACRSLIVDAASLAQIDGLLRDIDAPLLLLLPDIKEVEDLRKRFPLHTILGTHDLEPPSAWTEPAVAPDDVAYFSSPQAALAFRRA